MNLFDGVATKQNIAKAVFNLSQLLSLQRRAARVTRLKTARTRRFHAGIESMHDTAKQWWLAAKKVNFAEMPCN